MGEFEKELMRDNELDWDRKCMMMVTAPLIAGLLISDRVRSAIQDANPEVSMANDWFSHEDLVQEAFRLYDELERQVTERLTAGEPRES